MKAIYFQKLIAYLLITLSPIQASIVSAETIVVKQRIVAEQLQQSANRRKDFTKVKSTDFTRSRDNIFEFFSSGNKYKIKADGSGTRALRNLKPTKFNLKIASSDFIESLSFLDFENNILILASITDNEITDYYFYSTPKTREMVDQPGDEIEFYSINEDEFTNY